MEKKIYNFFSVNVFFVLLLAFTGKAKAITYQDVVLADNPVLYLRFEDSNMANGTPVADIGSLGKGGTYIIKGVENSIDPVAGVIYRGYQAAYLNQAVTSSGSGACIDIDDTDGAFFLSDCTYEAWIKIAPGDLAYSRIFQHNGSWLEEGGPGITMSDYEDYGVIGGDTTNYFEAPTDDGQWHHVVVTYYSTGSGVIEELYVDAVSIGTASGPNNLSYRYDRLTIGAEGNKWWMYNHLKGAIDEFAIYDYILDYDSIYVHCTFPESATVLLLGLGGLMIRRLKFKT